MATELKPTGRFSLTRSVRKGVVSLQVTSPFGEDTDCSGYVTMNLAEAAELAEALKEAARGAREQVTA